MDKLKVIQINIRSLYSNKNLLEYLLNKEDIDVVLLSETWLKNEEFNISGYNIHLCNRIDGYGGVAVMVKKKYISKKITYNHNIEPIEHVWVEVLCQNKTFNFSSIYIPPNVNLDIIKPKFETYIDSIQHKTRMIFGGDINAYHPLWDNDDKTNGRGSALADIISNSHFRIMNNGRPTRQNIQQNTHSAIDITCVSPDLMLSTDWEVLCDNIGSDHMPISINIYLNSATDHIHNKTKLQFTKLEKNLPKVNFSSTQNIEQFEEKLQTIIEQHTKTSNAKHTTNKPWWNEKIHRLWTIKNEKQKIYNRNKTLYTATELKKAVATLKLEISTSKRESWDKFTSEINPNTPLKDIYARINLFNNKRQYKPNLFIDNDAKRIELLNINYKNIDYDIDPVYKKTNNDNISIDEIKDVINKNKNTAGGINKITNKILKLLSDEQLQILTKHINKMWNSQDFPGSWKQIRAVAFPKPNKDECDLNNYRIISLLNVFHKVVSKILKKKIVEHIDKHNIIPEDSYGFKEKVGINEYLVRLTQIIETNKKDGYGSVVIAIDISRAFDKVNPNILAEKMKNMHFDEQYIYWIIESITNRKLILDETANKCVSEGLPQGDVLSPILFNIYSAEIHELRNNYTEIVQYADDFTIVVRNKNMSQLNSLANVTMRRIKYKLNDLNFEINPDKCKYMCFNVPVYFRMVIYMFDDLIKREDSLNILGITLDSNLNFKKHTRQTKEKTQKYTNLFKIFNYKRGGAHPTSLLNVHNALIKSRTTYGAPCVATKLKMNHSILQVVHNATLRMSLGMTKTCPISAILGEASEWPVEYQQTWCCIKFICKHIYSNTRIGIDIKNNMCTKLLNNLYRDFDILKSIPVIRHACIIHNNIKVNCDIDKFAKTNMNIENRMLANKIIQSYTNTNHIYTDGSKSDGIVGMGIYFDDSKEEFRSYLNYDISIKTTELIAIYLAIKLAISMDKQNIVIFTDSKSSCVSLRNSILQKKNYKYYEQKIIELANANKNRTIKIQWIPAHIGLPGNEIADKLAKESLKHNTTLYNTLELNLHIPPEDALYICKQTLHNKWVNEFERRTLNKGVFHASVIQKPQIKPWFRKSTLNSKQLKQILRIRSGHTYDKKHLYTMKLIDTNLCNTCNVPETAEHIIQHCTQHNITRQNYTNITTIGLSGMLKGRKEEDYENIIKFLQEINYKL